MAPYTEDNDKDDQDTKEGADAKKKGADLKVWLDRLESAKRATRDCNSDARAAWDEYLRNGVERNDRNRRVSSDKFPIYWASTKTIQPALYSQTPNVVAQKAFETLKDDTARLSSVMIERLARFLIRNCAFDRTMYATRDTFIHCGKATTRVYVESDIDTKPEKRYVIPQVTVDQMGMEQVTYIDAKGESPDPTLELKEDEQGIFVEIPVEQLKDVRICLEPVHFEDILHTPNARSEEETTWKAFRHTYTRKDMRRRFGADIANAASYQSKKEKDADSPDKDSETSEDTAACWEIWDYDSKRVHWLVEGYKDDFADQEDDIYELKSFFPSPAFMIGTCGPDSLYPVPDYVQLEPIVNQLNGMFQRLRRYIRSMRRLGIFDSSFEELKSLLDQLDDAEFLGVEKWKELVDKGGLEQAVQFFPVDKFGQAIQQFSQLINEFEQKLEMLWGIPDILKGTSDPNETAAAQQLKGKFLSLRFSTIQREFQRLVRDSIELMCDLALKKFPEDKLKSVFGYQFMKPEDQARYPQALLLLQDDKERLIRIDLETDSTITMNQALEMEQRSYLGKTIFDGLGEVTKALGENPAFAPIAVETMLHVVRGTTQGKQLEDVLQSCLDKMLEPKPPAPPPPDPAAMKAQAEIQVMQMKAQAEVAIAQYKAQAMAAIESQKLQGQMVMEQQQAGHEMQLEATDAANQQKRLDLEAQLKVLGANLEAQLRREEHVADTETKRMEVEGKVMAAQVPDGPKSETIHIHNGPSLVAPEGA